MSSYPGSSNTKVHNVSALYLLLLSAKYSISVAAAGGSAVNCRFAEVHPGLWLPVTELCLWVPLLTVSADTVHRHQRGHTCGSYPLSYSELWGEGRHRRGPALILVYERALIFGPRGSSQTPTLV